MDRAFLLSCPHGALALISSGKHLRVCQQGRLDPGTLGGTGAQAWPAEAGTEAREAGCPSQPPGALPEALSTGGARQPSPPGSWALPVAGRSPGAPCRHSPLEAFPGGWALPTPREKKHPGKLLQVPLPEASAGQGEGPGHGRHLSMWEPPGACPAALPQAHRCPPPLPAPHPPWPALLKAFTGPAPQQPQEARAGEMGGHVFLSKGQQEALH